MRVFVGFLVLCLFATAATAYTDKLPASGKVAHVTGVVDDGLAMSFLSELESTSALRGEQYILIDSPGGSVSSGNAMVEAIEAEKKAGTHVTCIVTGMAASMAFNLLTHCDTRIADTKAVLLFHKVALSDMPPIRLSAYNLRKIAEMMDAVDAPYDLANRTALGMEATEYDFYADQQTWWSPEMLKRLGYLQEIHDYHESDSK